MINNLWNSNTPRYFWLCQPEPTDEQWQFAIQKASQAFDLPGNPENISQLLSLTLGENQFGPDHFKLNTLKRIYYTLKPSFPRMLIDTIKKVSSTQAKQCFLLDWPVEDRFVSFLWDVIRNLLLEMGQPEIRFRYFWPDGKEYALVLTHDVDTKEGLEFIPELVKLEEKLGFRSSFNIVPEKYPIKNGIVKSLQERGFEVGVHGLKHDGKEFNSYEVFSHRVKSINQYLKKFNATGFRAPLMHRNPEWMQELEIDYDMSFFDTDPYEPLPGGTMSIWPFFIGRFVELPYTLVQDCTLVTVLGETTPKLWFDKLNFIQRYNGMALLNTHPDYCRDERIYNIYESFLQTVKDQGNYWHALPGEVAQWWRQRALNPGQENTSRVVMGTISLRDNQILVERAASTRESIDNIN
ncbi:MAG: hypothetical protein ACM3PY_18760 [Omnitrophica WOR_2 bacterium]